LGKGGKKEKNIYAKGFVKWEVSQFMFLREKSQDREKPRKKASWRVSFGEIREGGK